MGIADGALKQALRGLAEEQIADLLEPMLRGGVGAAEAAVLEEAAVDLEGAARALRAKNPRGRPRKDRAAALLADAVAALVVRGVG